ncbi:MAG: translocation/assembly module TamB domain-containing protein [Myxococcales bacterium]|nr:translocation/assembly module TamB domain-containing protein [Myxococcales bacterium]
MLALRPIALLASCLLLLLACERDAAPKLTDLGPEVARQLSQRLGLPVRVKRAELQLERRAIVAAGVEVDARDGSPLLRNAELTLSAGEGERLLQLERIELRGGEVTLDGREQAAASLLDTGADTKAPIELTAHDTRWAIELDSGRLQLQAKALKLRRSDDASFDFEIEGAKLVLTHGEYSHRLSAFESRGRLDAEALRFERLLAQGEEASAELSRLSLPRPLGQGFEAEGRASFPLSELRALWPQASHWPALDGQAEARGSLALGAGAASGTDLRLEVEAPRLQQRTLGERLSLRALGTAGVQGELELSAEAGKVHFEGPLGAFEQPPAENTEVTLRFEEADLGAVAELLSWPALPLRGRLDGQWRLGRDQASAAMAGPLEISLTKPTLVTADGKTISELSIPTLELAGRAALMDAGATVEDLQLSFPVGLQLGSQRFRRASAQLIVDAEGGPQLSQLEAEGQGIRLRSERPLDLRWPQGALSLDAALKLQRTRPAALVALLGLEDDSGLGALEAELDGSVQVSLDTEALRAELDLKGGNARLAAIDFDAVELKASLHRGRGPRSAGKRRGPEGLKLSALTLSRGGGRASLSGTLGPGGARALSVRVRHLPLAGVYGLEGGSLDGDGELGGDRKQPTGRLRMKLGAVRAAGQSLGQANLRATLASRQAPPGATERCPVASAALERAPFERAWLVCGEGLGKRLELDLMVGSGDRSDVAGRIVVRELDLSPWLPAPFDGRHGGARASLALALQAGELGRPESLQGQLTLEALELRYAAARLDTVEPAKLALRDGRIELGELPLLGERAKLTLQGTLTTTDGPQLRGEGMLAASLLAGLSPFVDSAYGDIDVAFTMDTERGLRATLHPREALVTVDPGGLPVRKVRGELRFDGQALVLEALEGELGGGRLELSGRFEFEGGAIARYALKLTGRDLVLEPQPRFELALDADTTIEWQGQGLPHWQGEIALSKLLYARHIQIPEALIAINDREAREQGSYDPGRDRFSMALRLRDLQPIRIRNDAIDASFSSNDGFELVGTDQRFGLLGELKVVEGRVLFRGDEFTLQRGSMSFGDRQRIAPRFQVLASAKARKRRGADIVFRAKGDRDLFELSVVCEPRSGDGAPVPPPFRCDYRDNAVHCDDFDALLTLWLCRPEGEPLVERR